MEYRCGVVFFFVPGMSGFEKSMDSLQRTEEWERSTIAGGIGSILLSLFILILGLAQ